jgi:hypothetical protein
MWMLVTTICLQLSATDAECRREVQRPVPVPMMCRSRMEAQRDALLALADDLNARVMFISVSCKRGRDG